MIFQVSPSIIPHCITLDTWNSFRLKDSLLQLSINFKATFFIILGYYLRGLFTSRGCRRRRCEERSECGNLMLVAKNNEITTLSSIARDDVVIHRDYAVTK